MIGPIAIILGIAIFVAGYVVGLLHTSWALKRELKERSDE